VDIYDAGWRRRRRDFPRERSLPEGPVRPRPDALALFVRSETTQSDLPTHDLLFARKRRELLSANYLRGRRTATCPSGQVRRIYQSRILALCGGEMGIATDILNLRHNQLSSVTLLLSALERFNNSPHERALNRLFQVDEAADLVLTNVAAHAAEALIAPQPTKGTTQKVFSMRQRSRRFNAGPSTLQRPLFAVRSAS
jgi:hypothetical protein